jgi:hypothetical protein
MRVAPYLLSAILLAAMFGTTHAAPTTIEGFWSGSGIAKFRNCTDRMVCRVNFARLEQKSFRVSAVCSAGDRRYEQSGRVEHRRESLSRLRLQRPVQREGERVAFAEPFSPDGQRQWPPRFGEPDPVEKRGLTVSSP